MTAPTLLLTDERMLEHDAGRGHPERPDRLRAAVDGLDRAAFGHVAWATPRPAARERLLAVHTERHVANLESIAGTECTIDGDTRVSPASHEAALLAAGAAIDAVDAMLAGEASSAFALVRPPGHHAERDRAMGFCLYDNVAVAAAHAIDVHGLRRVLIADWDVHHGNGTQDVFDDRDDVLVVSAHQWPLYPGTGALSEVGTGPGRGYTVNLPLPPGRYDHDYLALFEHVVAPIADDFAPELVLVSAGYDADTRDPLGSMRLSPRGFADLLRVLRGVADRHAGGRIALALEGGYDLDAVAEGVVECVGALAPGDRTAPPPIDLPANLEPLREAHAEHWPGLREHP